MTNWRTTDLTVQAGDVIEDSYGNPAVVLEVSQGKPTLVMMTTGSDRGRQDGGFRGIGSIPRLLTGDRAEWARDIARSEWGKGNRW